MVRPSLPTIPPSPSLSPRKCEYGNPESLSRIFPHQTGGGGEGGNNKNTYLHLRGKIQATYTLKNINKLPFEHEIYRIVQRLDQIFSRKFNRKLFFINTSI